MKIKQHNTLTPACCCLVARSVFCIWKLYMFVKFDLEPDLMGLLRTQCRCRSKETHLLSHGNQKQQQHMGHASEFPFLVLSIGKCCLSNISICNFCISLPKVKSQLGLMGRKKKKKKIRTSLPNMCVFNPG